MKRTMEIDQEANGDLNRFIQTSISSNDSSQIFVLLSTLSSISSLASSISPASLLLIGDLLVADKSSILYSTKDISKEDLEIETVNCIINISILDPHSKSILLPKVLPFFQSKSLSIVLTNLLNVATGPLPENISVEVYRLVSLLFQFVANDEYFLKEMVEVFGIILGNLTRFDVELVDEVCFCCFFAVADEITGEKMSKFNLVSCCNKALQNSSVQHDLSVLRINENPTTQSAANAQNQIIDFSSSFVFLIGIKLVADGLGSLSQSDFDFLTDSLKNEKLISPIMSILTNFTRINLQRTGNSDVFVKELFDFLQKVNFSVDILNRCKEMDDEKTLFEWFEFFSTLFLYSYFPNTDSIVVLVNEVVTLLFQRLSFLPASCPDNSDQYLQLIRSILIFTNVSVSPADLSYLLARLSSFDVYSLGILNILATRDCYLDDYLACLDSVILNSSEIDVKNSLDFFVEVVNGMIDIFGSDTRDVVYEKCKMQSILENLNRKLAIVSKKCRNAKETSETLQEFIQYMKR